MSALGILALSLSLYGVNFVVGVVASAHVRPELELEASTILAGVHCEQLQAMPSYKDPFCLKGLLLLSSS